MYLVITVAIARHRADPVILACPIWYALAICQSITRNLYQTVNAITTTYLFQVVQ